MLALTGGGCAKLDVPEVYNLVEDKVISLWTYTIQVFPHTEILISLSFSIDIDSFQFVVVVVVHSQSLFFTEAFIPKLVIKCSFMTV